MAEVFTELKEAKTARTAPYYIAGALAAIAILRTGKARWAFLMFLPDLKFFIDDLITKSKEEK